MNALGCTECGSIIRTGDPLCACSDSGWFVALSSAADVLAFKLRCAGRPDEAVTVEDRHAVLQEGHGPC